MFHNFLRFIKLFALFSTLALTSSNPLAEGDYIGVTAVDLDATSCLTTECNLGNLIADSMRYSYFIEELPAQSEGLVVLVPGNRIRKSIVKDSNLTDSTIRDILPSTDDLVVKQLTGDVIVKALEMSVQRYNQQSGSPDFMQVSNVWVEFDFAQEAGKRLVSCKVLGSQSQVYETIKDTAKYDVVMSNTLMKEVFDKIDSSGDSRKLKDNDFDATKFYVSRHSPVIASIDGRIVVHNVDKAPTGHGVGIKGSVFGIALVSLVQMAKYF